MLDPHICSSSPLKIMLLLKLESKASYGLVNHFQTNSNGYHPKAPVPISLQSWDQMSYL